jgi:acetyl-CoA acyltransferase
MTGFHISPNPYMAENNPEVYMGMEAQDEFAYNSHRKAAAAQDQGIFRDEITPVEIKEVAVGPDGKARETVITFETDEHLRRETTVEGLAKLKPSFMEGGSVTAGNSSPLSDGAAALLVMERSLAEQLGLKPLARFVGFGVSGVRPEVMGIGPVQAVPKVLQRTGMKLDDIDLIELNEAFAAQALAVIRLLEMDPEKVNVNGGAIALGHPLGCTGSKLTVQLLNEMKRRNARYGMVTMCVGGGQGAAGIFENLN